MLRYHEIYPLENAANKIGEELDYLCKTKPRMYKTTKDKYKKLACQLLDSVDKISLLLAEEALVSDSLDEFDELSSSFDALPDIRSRLDHIRSSFDLTQSFSGPPVVSEETSIQKDIHTSSISRSTTDSNSSCKLEYSSIVHSYANVLDDCADSYSGYVEVKECANLIRNWFNCRFVLHSENFIYNIRQLPIWISSIITLYGKYQKDSNTDELLSMFDKWMLDIDLGKNTQWAVPYSVLQLTKNPKPEDFTINAVLINDLLFNSHYYQLTSYHDSTLQVCLSSDQVVTSVRDNNPSLVPKIRTRLIKQLELIEDCGLHDLEEQ